MAGRQAPRRAPDRPSKQASKNASGSGGLLSSRPRRHGTVRAGRWKRGEGEEFSLPLDKCTSRGTIAT
jgi:hypothetical protein